MKPIKETRKLLRERVSKLRQRKVFFMKEIEQEDPEASICCYCQVGKQMSHLLDMVWTLAGEQASFYTRSVNSGCPASDSRGVAEKYALSCVPGCPS